MASTDAAYGLIVIIVPIVILVVGLGLSRFLPTKKRLIGIILILIGALGSVIFGAGFISTLSNRKMAGIVGVGSLFAVELVTLAVGVFMSRKKSSQPLPIQNKESNNPS
ncbi:MAG: hypothetical protein NWE96_00825 [Candidatus Bathyarchaeota archaeon]|nr:hypothetical protein [Candidatus Bathyarchaeota archaeon]